MLFLYSRLTSNEYTKLTNAGYASCFYHVSQMRLPPMELKDLLIATGGQDTYLFRIPRTIFDIEEGDITQDQVIRNKSHIFFWC